MKTPGTSCRKLSNSPNVLPGFGILEYSFLLHSCKFPRKVPEIVSATSSYRAAVSVWGGGAGEGSNSEAELND